MSKEFGISEISDVVLYDKENGEVVERFDSVKVSITSSLASQSVVCYPKQYVLDMSKVNTLEDLKTVIESLNIVLTQYAHNFDKVKQFLKEVE